MMKYMTNISESEKYNELFPNEARLYSTSQELCIWFVTFFYGLI